MKIHKIFVKIIILSCMIASYFLTSFAHPENFPDIRLLTNHKTVVSNTVKKYDPLLVIVLMVKNEAGVIIQTLQPYVDAGLACSLLEITSERQLSTHYMRGNLFESFIFAKLEPSRLTSDNSEKIDNSKGFIAIPCSAKNCK